MAFHGSVAKAQRERKEKYPELYCDAPGCLWRVVNARDGSFTPCRKHPHLNKEKERQTTQA